MIARNSGGQNLVGRPQERRPWYPTNRVRPVRVEVFVRSDDEVAAAARSLGTFAPGQQVRILYNVVTPKNLILSTVGTSPNGKRSVRELADAHEVAAASPAGRTGPAPPAPLPTSGNNYTVPTGVRFPDYAPGRTTRGGNRGR